MLTVEISYVVLTKDLKMTICSAFVIVIRLCVFPELSYFLFWVQITTFNISLVVHGTIAENMDYAKVIKLLFYLNMHILAQNNCQLCMYQDDSNPYAVPIAMGIYHRLESPLDITTSTIIRRIVANHEAYQV